eukprot:1160475-Pelagomonas_calceolata.AAC.4
MTPERELRSPWNGGALPERELGGLLVEESPSFLVAAAKLVQGALPEREFGGPLLEERPCFLVAAAKLVQGALPERELGGPLREERPCFLVVAAKLVQGALPERESGRPLIEDNVRFHPRMAVGVSKRTRKKAKVPPGSAEACLGAAVWGKAARVWWGCQALYASCAAPPGWPQRWACICACALSQHVTCGC